MAPSDPTPSTFFFASAFFFPAQEIAYGSLSNLKDVMRLYFGKELGVPNLQEKDLGHLDDAIMLLTPPVAQVHLVEVDTFMVSVSASASRRKRDA